MTEILDYLDREKLKISFSTLIIRVSSINKYFGPLAEFVKQADLYGVTNGKLYLMAEMMEPPYGLYNLVDNHFIPLGLEEGRDYVFVTEQLPLVVGGTENPLLNKPIPELEKVNWLNSIITREGNYVWYREDAPLHFKKKSSLKRVF
jgi:hypothetical protein